METTSFDIFWEGDRGYFALGEFSYDSDLNGSIITRDNLEDLQISFFDPTGFLVGFFDYDFPLDSDNEFLFTFDSSTRTLIQTGNFDQPDGLDLGINFSTETGLDFITFFDEGNTPPSLEINLDLSTVVNSEDDIIEIDENGPVEVFPAETPVDFFWSGDGGYKAYGSIFYPSELEGQLISRDNLTFANLFITNPAGALIGEFFYEPPFSESDEFRLTYNSATGEILQGGSFDSPLGFDLGINFNEEAGLDFITFVDPEITDNAPVEINLDQITIPGDDVNGLNELDSGGEVVALPENLDAESNFSLSDLVDASFYVANNPDVAAAIADGSVPDPLTHYSEFGQFEGRDPNGAFDASYYVENNLDIAGLLLTGRQGIGDHYVSIGHLEQREFDGFFEPLIYLSNNPDVLSAVRSGEFASAGEHYFKFGAAEGRSGFFTGVDLI
ncbi:MAG: hypothetical protein ACFCA4_08980 [Cyanophyceae cyanobacterium]